MVVVAERHHMPIWHTCMYRRNGCFVMNEHRPIAWMITYDLQNTNPLQEMPHFDPEKDCKKDCNTKQENIEDMV